MAEEWQLTKEDLEDEVHKFLWDAFGRQVQELVENIQADLHAQLTRFLEDPAMEPQRVQLLLTEACKHVAAEQLPRHHQAKSQDIAIMEGPTFQTPPSPVTAGKSGIFVQPPSSVSEPSCPAGDPPALCVASLSGDQAHRSSQNLEQKDAPRSGNVNAQLLPGAVVENSGAQDAFVCSACRYCVNQRNNSAACSSSSKSSNEEVKGSYLPLPKASLRNAGEGDFAAGDRAAGMQVVETAKPLTAPSTGAVQESRNQKASKEKKSTTVHSHALFAPAEQFAPTRSYASAISASASQAAESTGVKSFLVASANYVKETGLTFGPRLQSKDKVGHVGSSARARSSVLTEIGRHPCYRRVKSLVEGDVFDYCVAICLVINALVTGLQVNYMAGHIGEDVPTSYRAMEVAFCVIFTTELTLRISVYRCRFFAVKGWQWNLFDTVVVGLQLTEEVANAIKSTGSGDFLDNLSVLRMLRLGRIVRLVRMVRLIPELKSMVYLIFASMWSFFWTTTLLVFFMYGIAVYFTELVAEHVRKVQEDAVASDVVLGALKDDWGSVQRSVLSLYQAITGGRDWADLTEPLMDEVSWLAVMIFTLYIAFATLVMLNLVTGVFVEGAQRIIKEDKDSDLVKHLRKLFLSSDVDSDREISWPEFEAQLDKSGMEEYFKAIDVSRSQAHELFCLLDTDESGVLSIQEFVRGCIRLRGPARSIDLSALMYDCTRNFKTLTDRADDNAEDIAEIKSALFSSGAEQGTSSESRRGSKASRRGSQSPRRSRASMLAKSMIVKGNVDANSGIPYFNPDNLAETPRSNCSEELLS